MYGKYKNQAYSLRLDKDLMEKIRKLAEENYRPVSKQIELMLVEWLEMNSKRDNE